MFVCKRRRPTQQSATVENTVPIEAPHRRHVLQQDADAIGGVGDSRRQAEEHEDRQGQKRTTAGDHVDDSGDTAGEKQKQVPEGTHNGLEYQRPLGLSR